MHYLLEQQADDGGWHSETYGALRGGAANTALILYAFSFLPPDLVEAHRDALIEGRKFLEQGVESKGYVCNLDGSPDYTNYASAMLLIANEKLELGLSDKHRRALISYLLESRIGTLHEYEPSHLEYGGWDLMGWAREPRSTMGTNISVTSIATEALQLAGELANQREAVRQEIIAWLSGCQNLETDGGFYFHPRKDHDGNKAGWHDEERDEVRAYGTSTCDGLRLLMQLQIEADDPRLQAAVDWLNQQAAVDQVPGFEHFQQPTGWEEGLLFYYLFSYSTVHSELVRQQAGREGDESSRVDHRELAAGMIEWLIDDQHIEGHWSNDNTRMREDDPLIATSFALIALQLLSDANP